jgi:hypothetical protein
MKQLLRHPDGPLSTPAAGNIYTDYASDTQTEVSTSSTSTLVDTVTSGIVHNKIRQVSIYI